MKNLIMIFISLSSTQAMAKPFACSELAGLGTEARFIAALETAVVENAWTKYTNRPSAENKAALDSAMKEQVRARSEFAAFCVPILKTPKDCSKLTGLASDARLVAALETAVVENSVAKYQQKPSAENKAALESAQTEQVRVRSEFMQLCVAVQNK